MAVRILRTQEEKNRTRALYEAVFPEDSRAFLDYYYEDRCRDNSIVVKECGGEILSMAHLNPFRMRVFGREVPAVYIYAVATREDCRHRGYMREVLGEAFSLMREDHIPFCFLIPVEEEIYLPFGFRKIAKLREEGTLLPETELAAGYDIYCIRDADYIRRREREKLLEEQEAGAAAAEDGGGNAGLPADPVVMAKPLDLSVFRTLSGLPASAREPEMLCWLSRQRIWISESV